MVPPLQCYLGTLERSPWGSGSVYTDQLCTCPKVHAGTAKIKFNVRYTGMGYLGMAASQMTQPEVDMVRPGSDVSAMGCIATLFQIQV